MADIFGGDYGRILKFVCKAGNWIYITQCQAEHEILTPQKFQLMPIICCTKVSKCKLLFFANFLGLLQEQKVAIFCYTWNYVLLPNMWGWHILHYQLCLFSTWSLIIIFSCAQWGALLPRIITQRKAKLNSFQVSPRLILPCPHYKGIFAKLSKNKL